MEYRTPHHGLPLPPPNPGRSLPVFNGNGQYRLPDPETGLMTSYTRASTVAKSLEDTWSLDKWAKRMMLIGLHRNKSLMADVDKTILDHLGEGREFRYLASDLRRPLDELSEEAQHHAGSTLASEWGTAAHAWCEWVDLGRGHVSGVPTMFRDHVKAYRLKLAHCGLIADPSWTERIVLNTRYGIAGTLDRLFRDADGTLLLGDVKTSGSMEHGWLYFVIQLAIYHGAQFALSEDGTSWEPMPAIDPHTALIAHLPREDADGAHIVPMDMQFGADALHTAVTVRRYRTTAEKRAHDVRYEAEPQDPRTRRQHTARGLVEISETREELAAVWEDYRDVWNDALTELSWKTIRLADESRCS